MVRMRSKEGKKGVMQKKGALKGRREKIEDDWMRKERMIQWRLARENGKRIEER